MIIDREIQDAPFKHLCHAISKLTDLSSISSPPTGSRTGEYMTLRFKVEEFMSLIVLRGLIFLYI